MAIHRLERQAEQEQQSSTLLQSKKSAVRTYEEKLELQFRERVVNATDWCGCHQPSYRQMSSDSDRQLPLALLSTVSINIAAWNLFLSVEEFIERLRRYDQLVVPRRKLGEEHVFRIENDPYEHNVLPWDLTFDADEEQRRRVALLEWQEEERVKEQEMVLADFNKFKMNDVRHLAPGEQKKAAQGFGVSSGVNARIRTVRDKAKADVQRTAAEQKEAERIAAIRRDFVQTAQDYSAPAHQVVPIRWLTQEHRDPSVQVAP